MEQPLVSIVIMTYNSSKYVLETLESAKRQTYKNIELVISDDASKDNTVEICQEWLGENSSRFANVKLVTSLENTGIAPNANRGWRQAKGLWVKGIAGDDKLLTNCIADDMDFVTHHPETDILFSKIVPIGNMEAAKNCGFLNVGKFFENLDKKEFEINLLWANFLPAASEFISRSCFLELGGWDESMPFMEDWPFWIKALEHNKTMSFLNKETVCYRFSQGSISQRQTNSKVFQKYMDSYNRVIMMAHRILYAKYPGAHYYFKTLEMKSKGNNLFKLLYYTNIINPFYYKLSEIKKLMKRRK